METSKQKPDFLHIGSRLLSWYQKNARPLPWRETTDPYKIWISEVVLQQTQVRQGMQHYLSFVERFPDAASLADAHGDEVLLYWKGLGYYSRALNLHKAARQIRDEFGGAFPDNYNDVLRLSGVGRYTAAAVASICFSEPIPAVDGNFYRVLSRVFADDWDISSSSAFAHFSALALRMMPADRAGDFNQAMMDLGATVCKPRNPECGICPLNSDCIAFATGKTADFPVKSAKAKVKELSLKYYFVQNDSDFLVRRRGEDFIWKKLYEFPTDIPGFWQNSVGKSVKMKHRLTHRLLAIEITFINVKNRFDFEAYASGNGFFVINKEESALKSFPKPLQDYIEKHI